MISCTRTSLAIGFAVLICVPSASAALPKDFVGIESPETYSFVHDGNPSAAGENIAAQTQLGIHIHRQQFSWEEIETSKGGYDFSVHDRYMAEMAARGMRVLPVLFNAPPWHSAGKEDLTRGIFARPRGKALGKFGAALIKRYGPKGSFWKGKPRSWRKSAIRSWQIWNEPNLRYYWGDRPNAKQYVAVLRDTYKLMKKADRNAEIVTAGIPDSTTKRAIPLRKYIEQMYKAGAKKWFDTFGFNAYARNTKDLANKLKLIRSRMAKARDGKAKLWITEIGWADKGNKHYLVKGAKGQAREITKAIALIKKQRKSRKLRGFVYYQWRDPARTHREGISLGTWGFHAGLLKQGGGTKPAHKAFKVAVAKL